MNCCLYVTTLLQPRYKLVSIHQCIWLVCIWLAYIHQYTSVLYLYDILPIINDTDSTGVQNRQYCTDTDINCACTQSTMRLKWLPEGVQFGGSLALIPYKSTCQCVKSVTRKCLEEERTDGEQPNSNTLAVLTFAYISKQLHKH